MKQPSEPTHPEKDFTEEQQDGTSEELKSREQKKTQTSTEKPSVQRRPKKMTAEHLKEDVVKKSRMDTDSKKLLCQL